LDKTVDLLDNKGDKNSVGTINPQVVRVIAQEGDWLQIETWLGAKWIDSSAVRLSVRLDVPIFSQKKLGYPSGCEIVALDMMINYQSEADIKDLVSKMPRDIDPNKGYRGNPSSNDGFTVFPSALMGLTEEYLGGAQDMSGCSMEDLKAKLNSERPIVVWINSLGFNVHAVCLSGYDEKGFYYNDPWTGKKDSFLTYDAFYKIWHKPIFDKMLNVRYAAGKALSYN
jgi:uncharacterized protein YvpB